MILTKDEIQTITLNAKFVHKYADQVFFVSGVNDAPQRVGDQPFLNFFVRYHHRDAPERYSWSRVRRVLLLSDVNSAAQRTGTAPTVEWRGKTIWVCLAVEPVQHHTRAASSAAAGEVQEEELVMLPQLSNTVPTEEEVLAFCVASANQRPTEKYTDGVLGDAPVAPALLPDTALSDATTTFTATATAAAVDAADGSVMAPIPAEATTKTPAAAVADAPTSLNPRVFVPTHRQVELLRQYKKQHFTHHQWTEEEIEQSKVLRQRYSSIGVAAAPVRTVAYEHEHRVVERKQRTAATATAAPASQVRNLLEEVEVTQDPLSEHQTARGDDHPRTHTQHATSSAARTPTSPSATVYLHDAPLSPFLPRSVLRLQQQQQYRPAATAFADRASSDEQPFSAAMPGAHPSASSYSSQLDASSQTQGAETLSSLSRHLSQLRAAEDSFYRYISDEKRSHYLNRLANITLRNSATNAQRRRRGIANERRLERKGNLLESRGLWITDDKERAKQADDYVKTAVSGSSDAQKSDEKRAAKNAVAGSAGAGESSATTSSAEDAFVEKFKAYHDAQRISFADCADDLLSGTDADVESIVQAAAVSAAEAERDASANGTSDNNGGVSSPVRVGRRAVRRLLPNRLNTEEATPLAVQAQLVHRSTVRMAKRVREE
ncbi:hypothetical protein ABB37_07172 [Leptomonas pyrrhocoris]|uniref:Uncharacterized protein n=1 Tax=Leptomonas pyrrhocoris TaxID=157538 RepID=A0A0M9FWA7_LEPPY|nr:hypothetical protein ABB37_07172 [Leptomonas pyrrhocoris]KPA77279.1 hypothetical protein ABB37_07172 [Leptomonas pyrrhocoris]|eukprot:XP_015655718.1 hypothetical protein ABB37_07172 [Leptomonas pyrrhocoris]